MTGFVGGLLLSACGHSIPPSNDVLVAHLNGELQQCPRCHTGFDAWDVVRASFVDSGAAFALLNPLGGMALMADLVLEPQRVIELDLHTLGVPETAEIRSVNLTAQGGDADPADGFLVPAILFGNQPRLAKLQHQMMIYLVPHGVSPPASVRFGIYVQFIVREPALHRSVLLEAVYAHGDDDFRRAVIDAHTAADTALVTFLSAATGGALAANSRMSFLDKVGVADVLRRQKGFRPLPDKLVGALKELNVRRNQVAHPPKKSVAPLDQSRSADFLTAAVFLIAVAELGFGLVRGERRAGVEIAAGRSAS